MSTQPEKVPTTSASRQSSTATAYGVGNARYHIPQFVENDFGGSSIQEPWDEIGSEASEHARIWHVYNEEATKLDNAKTDGCNRGIDVLLVFTGLFSAVLTTFIIQSYQQMIPNPSDTTNALLAHLISLQAASLNGTADTNPPIITGKSPSLSDIHWVNGLWFAALACSLSAALVSMLAKQWIQPLPNGGSGSARYRARQRQRRHMHLRNWHVFAAINALPLLLHAALLLFFAGLIVLIWSGDIAITAATFTIVALVYAFYLGSMWMSLVYPDCPYQHPVSEHLRRWSLARKQRSFRRGRDLEDHVAKDLRSLRIAMTPPVVNPDDELDACAFIWLLQECQDNDVTEKTLQAIGGLSRDFSAFHLLREAGAIPLVLQMFGCCFHRDSTDLQWHVIDSESAERYCRAWVRLTHGTSEKWPAHLQGPLDLLKRMSDNIHVSTIAACTSALDALDSRDQQLALVSHLQAHKDSDSSISQLTQCWLLETFLECSLSWELQAAIVDDIAKKAVPVLLQLLQRVSCLPRSPTRNIIALTLHSLTGGNVDVSLLSDEEKQRNSYHMTIIPALASIVQDPACFDVTDEMLDFAAIELSRVAAPIISRSSHFPFAMKHAAREGLSKLYLDGRVGVGLIPDSIMADILQLLHPLPKLSSVQHPWLVKTLLRTMAGATDANLGLSAIRLLEPLLVECDHTVVEAFSENNGIAILVRTAHAGDTDSRRLQIDCIRTLCVFIQSSTQCSTLPLTLSGSPPTPGSPAELKSPLEEHCDVIFQSDFFSTLTSAVTARRWWLPEIADIWLPALLHLCRVRPRSAVWANVEMAFRNFAEKHDADDGAQRMLDDLKTMRAMTVTFPMEEG